MKYKPEMYARAFADVVKEIPEKKEEAYIRNFLETIRRNGDYGQIKKIFKETEKRVRLHSRRRKITVETARRKKSILARLSEFIRASDIVEEKITPSLIGGMRITINDEYVFDDTMKRKLNKLFR